MPGDPKECRDHAAQCFMLAAEAPTQVGKERFENLGQRWLALAADLEAAQALLKEWGDPQWNGAAKLIANASGPLAIRAAPPSSPGGIRPSRARLPRS